MISKTTLALALAFVAVFGAGAMIGTARHNSTNDSALSGANGKGGWLSRELELTTEQREQMRAIWSAVMSPENGRKAWDQRREIQAQREQAIERMLSDQQRQTRDRINAEYDQKLAELSRAQRTAFEQAVAQTRAILSPAQVAKYDEFLKRRGKGGGPRPFGKLPSTGPIQDDR